MSLTTVGRFLQGADIVIAEQIVSGEQRWKTISSGTEDLTNVELEVDYELFKGTVTPDAAKIKLTNLNRNFSIAGLVRNEFIRISIPSDSVSNNTATQQLFDTDGTLFRFSISTANSGGGILIRRTDNQPIEADLNYFRNLIPAGTVVNYGNGFSDTTTGTLGFAGNRLRISLTNGEGNDGGSLFNYALPASTFSFINDPSGDVYTSEIPTTDIGSNLNADGILTQFGTVISDSEENIIFNNIIGTDGDNSYIDIDMGTHTNINPQLMLSPNGANITFTIIQTDGIPPGTPITTFDVVTKPENEVIANKTPNSFDMLIPRDLLTQFFHADLNPNLVTKNNPFIVAQKLRWTINNEKRSIRFLWVMRYAPNNNE